VVDELISKIQKQMLEEIQKMIEAQAQIQEQRLVQIQKEFQAQVQIQEQRLVQIQKEFQAQVQIQEQRLVQIQEHAQRRAQEQERLQKQMQENIYSLYEQYDKLNEQLQDQDGMRMQIDEQKQQLIQNQMDISTLHEKVERLSRTLNHLFSSASLNVVQREPAISSATSNLLFGHQQSHHLLGGSSNALLYPAPIPAPRLPQIPAPIPAPIPGFPLTLPCYFQQKPY
jgi:hypothetical protein